MTNTITLTVKARLPCGHCIKVMAGHPYNDHKATLELLLETVKERVATHECERKVEQ